MVTAAIGTAVRVAGTISGILSALDQIEKARKDCDRLHKTPGMQTVAQRLHKELDRQEAKLRKSLAREISRRVKARAKARQQSRSSTGAFR